MDIATFLAAHQGKPVVVEGGNFSGRTDLLIHWVTFCQNKNRRAIYIGPCVRKYFSLLAANVYDELCLHSCAGPHKQFVLFLAELFGLGQCFGQSPSTLSGGEQVLLTVLSALSLEPMLLALDGTLSQLDRITKTKLIHAFSSSLAEKTAIVVTENGYPRDRADNLPIRRPICEFVKDPRETSPFCASNHRFPPLTEQGCLEAEKIYFAYGLKRPPLLGGISFQLEPGCIYSLKGKSGAGKRSLAQILTGALPVQRGKIFFAHRVISPWKNPGKVVVMQMRDPDLQLFFSTVRQELSGLPHCSLEAAAKLAGVENLLDKHPLDLPFVLRKRLTFSIIAHLRRPWYIFDEPILGQDAVTCDQMVLILRQMSKKGAGIIVISHSQEFIRRLEARKLWLENGLLTESGDSEVT